jgi:hypothetical protein
MNFSEKPWLGYMIAGGVVVMLGVQFLTPLSVAPIGPGGADWITGIIAAFWWLVGAVGGLAVYRVVVFAKSRQSNSN